MKLSEFDYQLPKNLIAQYPPKKRTLSRLMALWRVAKKIEHRENFSQIIEFLQPGDVLVVNDTRVISARLIGRRRTGGKVEMLLIEMKDDKATAMVQTRRRPQIGEEYFFADHRATVVGRNEKGWQIDFAGDEVAAIIHKIGYPPLPPYIKRKGEKFKQLLPQDQERYQTVYARNPGAIAAPTAGLHFTPQLITEIENKGVSIAYLTLHVGIATFLPVRAEKVEDHEMGKEFYRISEQTANLVNKAITEKKKVIAVGTTSCRALESAQVDGYLAHGEGWSDIFIYPGFRFHITRGLITNFHLPKSTLLLLVSAFAGKDFALEAYREAVHQEYRFYSYGDAMMII